MRSIYTDQETEKFIRKIKEKDPEFNLSSWFKINILSFGGGNEKSIVELSNKLEESKIKESEALAQQEYFRQKIAQLQLIQTTEQSKLEHEKIRGEEKRKGKKKNFLIYAPELFKLTKKELKDYPEEFSLSDYDTITDFLKDKGKKMKKPAEEEPMKGKDLILNEQDVEQVFALMEDVKIEDEKKQSL
tara:strand:+ start:36 stop:599 length:564 start_codon:yes stop_codon:yes gene_type:complete